MKKTIIASITTFFIGCASMYMIIRTYPLNISNINNNTNVVDRKFTVSEIGLSTGINNVYDSVVVVQNYKNDKSNGIGSGFIYNNDGYIMTNSHVIEGASNIKVMLMSGDAVDATIIGDDEYADIAVIKIDKNTYLFKLDTSYDTLLHKKENHFYFVSANFSLKNDYQNIIEFYK